MVSTCDDSPMNDATGPSDESQPADGGDGEPLVGIIMGSSSDSAVMAEAAAELASLGVSHEVRVISAHRSPERMVEYALVARGRGLQVIIAGAGGAAHLPGMVAALTTLPVIGVPVPTAHLGGQDSLLSIAQMPGGVPVATMAIGGARNAGLMAARILSVADSRLADALEEHRRSLVHYAIEQDEQLPRG
jgi:5-(carboxyamino)imidazole ribonucleotide mutase